MEGSQSVAKSAQAGSESVDVRRGGGEPERDRDGIHRVGREPERRFRCAKLLDTGSKAVEGE